MRLTSIEFSEFKGLEHEWILERFELGQVNLLVGRNATGKSRTINVMVALAQLLCGDRKSVYESGGFDVYFGGEKTDLHYQLEYLNNKIERELLHKGSDVLLRRTAPGSYGHIFAQEFGKEMRFQVPTQELAVVAKRDAEQHPFLEELFQWASFVRHFEFGKSMGHLNLGIPVKELPPYMNEKDTTQAVPIYSKGWNLYKEPFKDAIKADMATLGYDITEIAIRRPDKLQVAGPFPLDLFGISVKERGLSCFTDQPSMSQGMFRALSIIIQLNFLVMSKVGTCILVDDIGEGLDFERSCKLIEVMRNKANHSSVQLIMSTNDRFVMNSVPLTEWCVLQRQGHRIKVHNYKNSAHIFDRFKKTGLANFDFLATDFVERVK